LGGPGSPPVTGQNSPSATTTTTATPHVAAGDGRLVFLTPSAADQEIGIASTFQDPKSNAILKSPSLVVLASLDSQYDVGSACRLPPTFSKGETKRILPLLAPIAVALAGWVIEQAVTWVSNEISSELQAKVDAYTRSYVVESKTFDFYQSFTQNSSFDSNKLYRSCIRLTSLSADEKTGDPVLSDLLLAVTHQPGQTSTVTIRPVRLFVSKIQVPTSDNKAGITYSLTATTRARGINSVAAPETDFSGPILATTLDPISLKSQYFYKVYTGDEPGAGEHEYSIPAWDLTAIGNKPKNDEMTLSVTVTEVGDVPWLLKNINSLVKNNKDNATKSVVSSLQSAASSVINPTASPKKTSP